MKIPDLTQDEALIYLKYHLGTRYSNEELTSAVEIFGGRIFELQMLVSRVNTGIPLGSNGLYFVGYIYSFFFQRGC